MNNNQQINAGGTLQGWTPQPTEKPQPPNISALLNTALNRLGSLVKTTGEIAFYLGHREETGAGSSSPKCADSPGPTDWLHGVHELIYMLEQNVAHIQQRVG